MDIRLKAKIARRVHGPASFRQGRSISGVADAPSDGIAYVRRYSSWVPLETGESETMMSATSVLSCSGGSLVNSVAAWTHVGSVLWDGA